jgi:hypothetical protein
MQWRGRFICPLAVAGLGSSYFTMSFLVKLGHPLLVAFNRVDILGLHKDWCANLMAFAQIHIECVNVIMWIPG